METKQQNEIEVLKEVLAETKRFEKRIKELIDECKNGKNKHHSKYRGGVKRSAIDLKKELSRITTATGTYGVYYWTF